MAAEVRLIGGRYCVYANGVDTGKWASSSAKAAEIATRFGGVRAAPPREVERPAPPPPAAPPPVRPTARATAADRYPVLGGGVIETREKGEKTVRPFVVVRVAPDKVRPFYMSTGTGGQTEAGEWNLFGGIASGGMLGWFIKPIEGKRVEKYANVSAFLAKRFPDNVEAATRNILASVPTARSYIAHAEDVSGMEQRRMVARMGGELNRYLIDLEAIAPFEVQEEEYFPREGGSHKTVHVASRLRPAAPPPPARPAARPATPPPARPAQRGEMGPFPGEVMLAKPHKETEDYTGWWMSEKLDGMRAYWTGSELFSRNGKPVHAPKWFTDALPRMALDGELMTGRGQFNETISIVRKQKPIDTEWRRITFHVFDAPMQPGGCEQRWADMQGAVAGIPFVSAVEQVRCSSAKHLAETRATVAKLGGEGVMLRAPKSAYEHRRTGQLLKVKSFQDAEARITGYIPGEGKHAGRLGAYEAVLLKGPKTTFGVGTGMSDREREHPLPKGTVITIKFFELTPAGVPRFPSFVAARDYE